MIKKYLVLGFLAVVIASLSINQYLTSTSEKSSDQIKVNMTINFGSYEKNRMITMNKGSTVFDALNATCTVEFSSFKNLGKFITSIDGVNQTQDKYWIYFVDDKLAPVSADNYALVKNSEVAFVYVDSKTAMTYVS